MCHLFLISILCCKSHVTLRVHLMVEPIIVSMFRNLSPSDPVYKILLPHVYHTLPINELGRRTLLNPGGFFDSLTSMGTNGTIELMYIDYQQKFNFTALAFPVELETRGFERVAYPGTAKDPLPGYLYRDYGYMMWDTFYAYVKSIVEREYESDQAVAQSTRIQQWANETCHPSAGNLRGFPCRFENRTALVFTLTHFIFTATAGHASCSGQFDSYGFIPNRPLTMVCR